MTELQKPNSPDQPLSGDIPGDLMMFLTDTDDERDLFPEFQMEEQRIEEIMQELYKEIATDHAPPPHPPLYFPSVSVGGAGVESERCGPAVWDSESAVMVGMEFAGGNKMVAVAAEEEEEEEGMEVDGGGSAGCDEVLMMKMDGCDGSDESDQWLARVLGWAPVDVEEQWSLSK